MQSNIVDPLNDLYNYSHEMTISQVIKFFRRKGVDFTKTMIQNYVRVGAIDPPDGRVYRERHMKALAMVELLKPVYSLDEIKYIFKSVDVNETYDRFFEAYSKSCDFWDNRNDIENEQDFLLEITAFCAAAKRMTKLEKSKEPNEVYNVNL